jgi:hypothetical protein
MSRFAWIFDHDPRRILCGGTDRFGVGEGVGVGVSAECVDELGHLFVALMRRKDRSALSMPAAFQRSTIWPSRQRVTLRLVARAIEIIDSMGLRAVAATVLA